MPHQPSIPPIERLSERQQPKIDTTLVGKNKADINRELKRREDRQKRETVDRAIAKVKKKAKDGTGEETKDEYILRPVVYVPPVEEKKYTVLPRTIVPMLVEKPTVTLVGSYGSGDGPWSAAPAGYNIFPLQLALGGILIFVKGVLALTMAVESTVDMMRMGWTQVNKDVTCRVHTGKGSPAGIRSSKNPGVIPKRIEEFFGPDSIPDWEQYWGGSD